MLRDAREYFKKNNIKTHILATGEELGPYADTLKDCGYVIEQIPFERSFSFFWKLYKYLKSQKFDIVHTHCERAYIYTVIVAWLANRKSKIFYTIVDVYFHYSRYKRLLRKFHRYIARKLFSVESISIGESVRDLELRDFNNPTEIIYNWIDEDNFRVPTEDERRLARNEFGLYDDDFVLCTVGTCNEKKRHKDIFDSFARIKDKIPSLVLLHRGTGPDLDEEKEYVRKLEVEKNIRFVGYLDFLPKVYWASDVFIFSSKWEGLGSVIIQAIACGLPVILYEGMGMNDFKPSDGRNFGYWLEPKSTSFDKAILYLYKRRNKLISEYGSNARHFYETKFSREKSLRRLVNLYQDISPLS
jgi:glycosyltransferase involved in cell wall biosynthesis